MTMALWVIPTTLIFVVMAGFFSGAETAFISLNRLKLRHLVEAEVPIAIRISHFLSDPDRLLSTVLVGTNICIIAASAIFTGFMMHTFGTTVEWVAAAILTPVILVFSEIIPKALFRQKANEVVYFLIYPVLFACWIFAPINKIVSAWSSAILRAVGQRRRFGRSPFVSKEELRHLILESERGGAIDTYEKGLIYSIFEFGSIRAGQVMAPLDHLVFINAEKRVSDLLDMVRQKRYSRIPLYGEGSKQFIGFVSLLDILFEIDKETPLEKFARPLLHVSTDMLIDELLLLLRSQKQQIAIVTDVQKKAVGFITLEDILEELIGES